MLNPEEEVEPHKIPCERCFNGKIYIDVDDNEITPQQAETIEKLVSVCDCPECHGEGVIYIK